MAAARKREVELDAVITQQPDPVTAQLIPTTVSRTSPFRSPARDMQESLAARLREPAQSKTEVASGLIAGIIGATWVTGILIYAAL